MRSPTLAGFPAIGQPGPRKDPSAIGLGDSLWVRVVVRTPSVESFIQKYSRFLKEDRIFIFTKSSQAPGTRLRFTLELADGKALVSGEGTVTRVRADVGDRAKPPGMELRFVATDDASRKIVALMLNERGAQTSSAASTREMPPAPKPASLPTLPQTGSHSVFDPPPALPKALTPAAKKPFTEPTPFAKPAGPSPLLSGPIAGQRTDLPKRPGTLNRTMMGTGAIVQPPVPPALALAHAAAPPPPVAERPQSIVDRPLPPPLRPPAAMERKSLEPEQIEAPSVPIAVPKATATPAASETIPIETSDAETTGVKEAGASEGIVEEPNEPSIMSAPPTSDARAVALARTLAFAFEGPLVPPAPSGLDAESLFSAAASETQETESERAAWGLGGSQTEAEPETKRELPPRSATTPPDDLSRSFPGLDAPSSFAEAWRDETEIDVRTDTVPANPFSEVSDNAIEYFVEWSLDRSPNAARSTSFDAIPMSTATEGAVAVAAPIVEVPAKPARPTLSPFAPMPEPTPSVSGTKLGLIIGLAMGLAFGGGAMLLLRSRPSEAPAPAPFKLTEVAKPEVAKPEVAKPIAVAAAVNTPGEKSAETASFSITSKPPGAAVSIDGVGRGVTPLALNLTPGEHQAELTMERYAAMTLPIESPGSLEADLKRPHAQLVIRSTPPGGEVKVAGVRRGKAPVTLGVQAYESYTVEVSLPNAPVWRKKIYAKMPSNAVEAQLVVNVPKGKGGATKPNPPQNGKQTSPTAKPTTAPPPATRPGDLLSPNRGIR